MVQQINILWIGGGFVTEVNESLGGGGTSNVYNGDDGIGTVNTGSGGGGGVVYNGLSYDT